MKKILSVHGQAHVYSCQLITWTNDAVADKPGGEYIGERERGRDRRRE